MRNLTSIISSAIDGKKLRPIYLIDIEIPSGAVYISSTTTNISANGNTYIGCGDLSSIGNINDSGELQSANLDIVLSGIPVEQMKSLKTSDIQGSEVNIYFGVLDSNLMIDGNPSLLWTGIADTLTINYGKELSATVRCESEFIDWNRPRLRRYSDADQQAIYPGDKGFEFTPLMEDLDLEWGKST